MPDNILDILIRFGLDKSKANEAAAAIKNLGEETKKAGAEGVKAEEEVSKATEKTFTKKKELKDMIKQLGHEFPLLGQVGRLALNPIALASASIVAAFQIWKYRTDELTKALGGIEMPDVSSSAAEAVDKMSAAYDKLADKMAKAADHSEKIKQSLEETLKIIDANVALQKAMGVDNSVAGDTAKAFATVQAALALDADARSRKRGAGEPGSKDDETKLAEKYDAILKEATAAQEAAKARRFEIADMRALSPTDPKRVWYDWKFRMRYGMDATYDDALGIEDRAFATAQQQINNATAFQAGVKDRANRRSTIEAADKDIAEAKKVLGSAPSIFAGAGAAGFGIATQDLKSYDATKIQLGNGMSGIAALGTETAKLVEAMRYIVQALDNLKRANEVAAEAKRRTQ